MTDDMPPDDLNPYRSPGPHEPAVDLRNATSPAQWYRRSAILQCLTILIGVPAAFWDIETIVASGAVLLFAGMAAGIFAVRTGYGPGMVFGFSGPVMKVGCFALIYLNNWGPPHAAQPISRLALAYGAVFGALGVSTVINASQGDLADEAAPGDTVDTKP